MRSQSRLARNRSWGADSSWGLCMGKWMNHSTLYQEYPKNIWWWWSWWWCGRWTHTSHYFVHELSCEHCGLISFELTFGHECFCEVLVINFSSVFLHMISRDSLPPVPMHSTSFLPDPQTVAVVAPQGQFCETSVKIIMTVWYLQKMEQSKYNKHILCMLFSQTAPPKNQSRIRGITACIFFRKKTCMIL